MKNLKASASFSKLVVANLDAARQFYEKVVGVSDGHVIKSSITGRPLREIIYNDADGKPFLILFAYEDGQPATKGDMFLGFMTSDIDAFIGRAVDNGGKLLDPVHSSSFSGGTIKVAVVADPEGHWIELVQMG